MNLLTSQTVTVGVSVASGHSSWSVGPNYSMSRGGMGSLADAGDKLSTTFTPSGTEGFVQIIMTGTINGESVTAYFDIDIIGVTENYVTLTKL